MPYNLRHPPKVLVKRVIVIALGKALVSEAPTYEKRFRDLIVDSNLIPKKQGETTSDTPQRRLKAQG